MGCVMFGAIVSVPAASQFRVTPSAIKADGFGVSVATSDRIIAVGAPLDDTKGLNAGAVYLFDAATGKLKKKVFDYHPRADHRFGSSVAIAGDTLVAGAPGRSGNAGSMTWFKLSSGAPVGHFPNSVADGEMGASVAISGTTIVVGLPGQPVDFALPGGGTERRAAAGVLIVMDTRNPFGWRTLVASDPETGARLGDRTAISGNMVLGGAPLGTGTAGAEQGAVYVFDVSDSGMSEKRKLFAADGGAGDHFGQTLAILGGEAFVGAPDSGSGDGAIYWWDLKTDSLRKKLTGDTGAGLGTSLALDGATLVAGNPGSNSPAGAGVQGAGRLQLFDISNAGASLGFLDPISPSENAALGGAAAIAGRVVVGAALEEQENAIEQGAVYIFTPVLRPLPFAEVFRTGSYAPGINGGYIGSASQMLIGPTLMPFIQAPTTGVTSEGVWDFKTGAMLPVQRKGDPFFGAAKVADILFSNANSHRYSVSMAKGGGTGVNAANDIALFYHDEAGSHLILREGDAPTELSGAKIATLGGPVQDVQYTLLPAKLLPKTAGVTAANDSVMWMYRPAEGSWTQDTTVIREGVTTTLAAETIGEILPFPAINGGSEVNPGVYSFIAGLGATAATNQAVFHGTVDTPAVRKGDAAPGGGTFSSFLGVTNNGTHFLVRATLSGAATATSEGLWSDRNGSLELVARKGTAISGLPTGVTIKQFVNYALTTSGLVVLRCVLAGTGVNAASDGALVSIDSAGAAALLLREGDPVPGYGGGVINVIQRFDLTDGGVFQALCSVAKGATGADLALFEGTTAAQVFTGLQRPEMVVRKGTAFNVDGAEVVASIRIAPAASANGAMLNGLPRSIRDNGDAVSIFSVQYTDKREVVYQRN